VKHGGECHFVFRSFLIFQDYWLKFDDDKVSTATVDQIKELSGKGGGMFRSLVLCSLA
jgi:hypothetical protein